MDKNTSSEPKEKINICDKLLSTIRSTTPFRTGRSLYLHKHREDAAVANKTSPNVSLVTPPPTRDRCARVSKQSDPTTIDTAQMKGRVLPIHGQENRVPSMKLEYGNGVTNGGGDSNVNGMFSEFIDRAGRKIRSSNSSVGVRKPSNMRRDSLNDRVSDFISRAKHRFHTASSFVEVGKNGALKQDLGTKERRFKS